MAQHRQSGVVPPSLVEVSFPENCRTVFGWFLELDRVRGSSGFGPMPISHTEIRSWRKNTKRKLTLWEVNALVACDVAARTAYSIAALPKETMDKPASVEVGS